VLIETITGALKAGEDWTVLESFTSQEESR
jgi:hypothetical protein